MLPSVPSKNMPTPAQTTTGAPPGHVRAIAARLEAATARNSVGSVANRSEIFSSATRQQTEKPSADRIFTSDDRETILESIDNDKKVFIAGYSSNGSGHTERMYTPLGKAVKEGDTVVLALPPHWNEDTGREAKTLDRFTKEYAKNGVKVVTVQSDKTVLGFLKEGGPADNFKALEEFANKAKRDSSQTPKYGSQTGEKVQGFKHHDIVRNLMAIVGEDHKSQIRVFEDMDPYLGKAAAKAGIPNDQIVGQSNHTLLLDAKEFLGSKSDAFLVKANGNGHNGKLATVGFSSEINSTRALGDTLSKLGITADQKIVDVRKDMVANILKYGNRVDLRSAEKIESTGSVLVSPNATSETIDRGAFLYLNAYTDPLAQHIRQRLNGEEGTTPDQQAAYEKAMFVICGGKALPEAPQNLNNAMHLAQAANFDGVANAGFGVMSEMHYLFEKNAYQGNLLLMPLEQHHEQEANAFSLMPAALKPENQERVDAAGNIDELKAKLDDLIFKKAVTNDQLGETTMEALLDATQREGEKLEDNAANLLSGGKMKPNDARLLEENSWRAAEGAGGRKQIRQLNKVMIPVLEALATGESEASIRLSTKVDERRVNVEEVVEGLGHPNTLRSATGVNITNQVARDKSEKFAESLKTIFQEAAGPARQKLADTYRKGDYVEEFTLGF